ncbi:MAG TPA: sigma-70 family RNA polymerase sigma factor [Ktedonobacteraceae bacterium]|nr:sigma-70 family RNA polymerase sigma factor [Ktedonobacteraceae bacterium]
MFSWRRTSGSNSSSPGVGNHSSTFARLLDAARRGESEALSTLYREFLPGVFGYIATRVPDRATAEDLTSEVFLKMVEGIGQLRASEEAGFAAWILQIARISVAGYYRKREKQPVHVPLESTSGEQEGDTENLAIPASHPDSDPVRWTEARDEWNTIVHAINLLTEEQRQVLVGRLLLGYDVASVARMLGKNENAIKALQFRALHSLQRLLAKEVPPDEIFPMEMRHRGGAR